MLCLLLFVVLCVASGLPQNNIVFKGPGVGSAELFEGDVCNTTDGNVWTCQKAENCATIMGDITNRKQVTTCGYEGKTPIVCCREEQSVRGAQQGNKSQQACQKYQELCSPPRLAIKITTPSSVSINTTTSFPPEQKEEPKFKPHFVIGGIPTVPKEYPHMALIGYGEAGSIAWSCGGSLISDRYILSAAHCTNPGPRVGPARWVRLGDLNIGTTNDDAKPQEYEIVSRFNHPQYKPPVLYNDIALYKLNQSVEFTQYVSPVCLHTLPQSYFSKVTAIGFGRIGPSGPISKHLMKVDVGVVPQEDCSQIIEQSNQLPRGIEEASMICAGEEQGGKDTCQGDSGGPLMMPFIDVGCVHKQVGVTSFGRICGAERSPGVYTRVSKYIPWIESIVWP